MSVPDQDPRAPADTLSGLFARLAEELSEVTVSASTEGTEGTEYRRGDRAFAAVADRAVEVRLHPEVAEAAQRTSHTTASSRGAGWVRFEPLSVDGFALDRAGAWFLSAWRAAER